MISRRNFIRAVFGAGLCGAGFAATQDSPVSMRTGIHTFARKLAQEAHAEVLGRTYLSLHADENDPERLLQEVMVNLVDVPWWSSQQTLERALRIEIDRDYAERRVEGVRGWILSKTELRLCALSVADPTLRGH